MSSSYATRKDSRLLRIAIAFALVLGAFVALPGLEAVGSDGTGPAGASTCTTPTEGGSRLFKFSFANGVEVCGAADVQNYDFSGVVLDGEGEPTEGTVTIHLSCSDAFTGIWQLNEESGQYELTGTGSFTGWSDSATGEPNPNNGDGWQILWFELINGVNGKPLDGCDQPDPTTTTTAPTTTSSSTTTTTTTTTTVPVTTTTTVPVVEDVLNISIVKTDDIESDTIVLDDDNPTKQFTYSLLVTNENTSNVTAEAVIVTDDLPDRLTPVSASSTAGNCIIDGQLVTCSLGDMVVGQQETVSITVSISRLPEGTATDATITNVAVVETEGNETTLEDNVDDEPLTITEVFPLIIEELPETGADTDTVAMVAGLMLLMGGALVAGSHYRRDEGLTVDRLS